MVSSSLCCIQYVRDHCSVCHVISVLIGIRVVCYVQCVCVACAVLHCVNVSLCVLRFNRAVLYVISLVCVSSIEGYQLKGFIIVCSCASVCVRAGLQVMCMFQRGLYMFCSCSCVCYHSCSYMFKVQY